jgi:virginiamycin B lyase
VLAAVAALTPLGEGASPALKIKKFPLKAASALELTAGPGGMWFTLNTHATPFGRITPAGVVKQWKLGAASTFDPDNSTGQNSIALGPDGNLWATGQASGRWVLVRIRPTGAATRVDLTMPNEPGKDAIAAVGTGAADKTVYYGIWWNTVGHVSTAGSVLPKIGPEAGFPQTAAALGWAADRAGRMWFVYGRGYGVVDSTAKVSSWEPAGKHNFIDITRGPDGNMWVADHNQAEKKGIGRISPDGTLKVYAVAGGPHSIAAGPDRNVWFTLDWKPGIGRISPTGKVKIYPLPGESPAALAAGFGKLWFVTDNGGAIARVDLPAA